jgi:probable phosphoglycerate mutase
MSREDTIVDLIRHGEPRGGRMIRGQGVDHPLSVLGWQQMWRAVGDDVPWDQVISSPMARCRVFANRLAAHHGLPLAVDPELREIAMGAWEGRRPAELAHEQPDTFTAFRRDPVANRPPGGERLEALQKRVAHAYGRQLASYPGRHLLIICHAGVMRAIIGHALNADPQHWYRLRIDYAGTARIRHDGFGASLEYVNADSIRV